MKFEEITREVIGCFYAVHNEMGSGFVETVYQNSLGIAFTDAGISFKREYPLVAKFRDQIVGDFRVDFLVEEQVIVELKAVSNILKAHEVQVVNYLRASGLSVGLLLNFGAKPEFKRKILGF